MKYMVNFLLLLITLCGLPSLATSSCLNCIERYPIEREVALDKAEAALDSDLGEAVLLIIEDLGGEVEMSALREVLLPQAEVLLIPAGENETAQLTIICINNNENDPLLAVLEIPYEIYDLLNAFTIYMPTGEIITFEDTGVITSSNIKPSVDLINCLYYVICYSLVPSPINLFCFYFLYLCFV